ncbi:propanediol utilization protein [Roseinatronobacter sp.]
MTARSIRVNGHFGEWLQGRLGPNGPVVLITMPCACTGVDVFLHPRSAQKHIGDMPVVAHYPPQAINALLSALNLGTEGHFRIVPRVAAGMGTGVSTAGLMGIVTLAGWKGPPEQLAKACIATEGASDPLMFSEADSLLWGSRDGIIHARVHAPPPHEVLGAFWGGPRPTDARDHDFPDIADLAQDWQMARRLSDFAGLAAESARRCLARRGPETDPTDSIAASLGALGWNMAHTGAARGFIFKPGTVPPDAPAVLRNAGYHGLLRFKGGRA